MLEPANAKVRKILDAVHELIDLPLADDAGEAIVNENDEIDPAAGHAAALEKVIRACSVAPQFTAFDPVHESESVRKLIAAVSELANLAMSCAMAQHGAGYVMNEQGQRIEVTAAHEAAYKKMVRAYEAVCPTEESTIANT